MHVGSASSDSRHARVHSSRRVPRRGLLRTGLRAVRRRHLRAVSPTRNVPGVAAAQAVELIVHRVPPTAMVALTRHWLAARARVDSGACLATITATHRAE